MGTGEEGKKPLPEVDVILGGQYEEPKKPLREVEVILGESTGEGSERPPQWPGDVRRGESSRATGPEKLVIIDKPVNNGDTPKKD